MEENGDAISEASHLESGKAIEEIGARSATFVRCGTRPSRLRILQIFTGPLLYESRDECARHAEKEAEEHTYVDADGRRRDALLDDGLGSDGWDDCAIRQCNELAKK